MSLHIKELHEEETGSANDVGPKTTMRKNCREFDLHCSYWIPSVRPIRGLVYLSHGYAEHLQWYENLALQLNEVGLIAFGHDHIGHGRSAGVKGDVQTGEEYILDVIGHCQAVKSHYAKLDLPLFIVGHSLGGMIAIRSAQCRPNLFAGVVLIGPLIEPDKNEATPFKLAAVKVLSALTPLLAVVNLKISSVTRDNEMKEKLAKDPLRYHGGIRARFANECTHELVYLKSNMNAVSWPFLILHGEKDRLCCPDAAQRFYDDAEVKDKTIKIFPSAYHHLYLELPDVRREAMNDTVNWITKRITTVD